MSRSCEVCSKTYASINSLCNHKRKIHGIVKSVNIHTPIHMVSTNDPQKPATHSNAICKYCGKELCNSKSRWRHEKKCSKANEPNIMEIVEELRKEIKELKSQRDEKPSQTNQTNNNKSIINSSNCNMFNISYKPVFNINNPSNNFDNKIEQEDALKILQGRMRNMITDIVSLIYSDDKYSNYRTAILKDIDAKTMEIYDDHSKQFEKKQTEDVINTLCDGFSFALNNIAQKNIDIIGDEKTDEIDNYTYNSTGDNDNLTRIYEKKKIKNVLSNNHKNAEKTRKIYMEQKED
jgi:hypothetical protein